MATLLTLILGSPTSHNFGSDFVVFLFCGKKFIIIFLAINPSKIYFRSKFAKNIAE
jgi:hypothetical protein